MLTRRGLARWAASGAAVGALLALVVSLLLPESFRSSTTLLVTPRVEEGLARGEQRLDLVTELEVLRSRDVTLAARRALGFRPFMDAQQVRSSAAVTITTEADTPERAARAADVYARTYVAQRRAQVTGPLTELRKQLERQASGLRVLAREGASLADLRAAATALDDPEVVRDLGLLESGVPVQAPELRVPVAVLRLAVVQRKLDEVDVALRAAEVTDPVVLGAARVPSGPVRPKVPLNVVLGALLGAAVASSVALLRQERQELVAAAEQV